MSFQIAALEYFLNYHGQKYIAPAKAGEEKDIMETFKKDGQTARQAFTELAQSVDQSLQDFHMQKVSSWMNQAQIGRPHFWCYFKREEESKHDPHFAIRLITLDDGLGISVEVSFIERGVVPETIVRQNQVLAVPIQAPLYYLAQSNGVFSRYEATEENRLFLQEAVADKTIRKVLVKVDIPKLSSYSDQEALVTAILEGFRLLSPYYLATK